MYGGKDLELEEYVEKNKNLSKQMNKLIIREKEDRHFPEYMELLDTLRNNVTNLIDAIKVNITWVPLEDLSPMERELKSFDEWIQKKKLEKENTPLTEDPVLTLEMINMETYLLKTFAKGLVDEIKDGPAKRFKNMDLKIHVLQKIIKSWHKCSPDDAPAKTDI